MRRPNQKIVQGIPEKEALELITNAVNQEQRRLDELKKEPLTIRKEIDSLGDSLVKIQKEKEFADKELNDLKEKINETGKLNALMSDETKIIKEAIEKAKEDLIIVNNQIGTQKEKYEQEKISVKRTIDEIKAIEENNRKERKMEMENINRDIDDLQSKKKIILKEIDNGNSVISIQGNLITSNDEKIQNLESKMETLIVKIKEMEQIQETLKEKNSLLVERIKEKSEAYNEILEKIKKVEIELNSNETRLLNITRREQLLTEMESRIKDLYDKAGIKISLPQ